MYKKLRFSIKSIVPVIHHSGRMTNPMNPIARQIKKITSKRGKTDSDFELISKIEWIGGLYSTLQDDGIIEVQGNDVRFEGFGVPCFPGEIIESALMDAAKTFKLGKVAQKAILVEGMWPIIYDGPKDVNDLWSDGRFAFIKNVRVQRASVMRTRPIFDDWALDFEVGYFPDIINEDDLIRVVKALGQNGFCEWRPRYGRFKLQSVEEVEAIAA